MCFSCIELSEEYRCRCSVIGCPYTQGLFLAENCDFLVSVSDTRDRLTVQCRP